MDCVAERPVSDTSPPRAFKGQRHEVTRPNLTKRLARFLAD